MAEPYRNRGGPVTEREYGAPRARAGWVLMSYPELPDNDPIEVLEAAVKAKEARGWEIVPVDAVPEADADDAGTWELTTDDD